MDRGKSARIADELRRRIAVGDYERTGQKLPTQRDLAAEFGTGKGTVDRALRDLEAEGLVTLIQGSGIYVRQRALYQRRLVGDVLDEHALAVAGEVDERGLFERMTGADQAGAEVDVATAYRQVPAPPRAAELLQVPAGTVVLERTWTYTLISGEVPEPYQVARSYMPLDVAEAAGLVGPESERKGIGTLWQLIQTAGIRLRLMHRRVEARMPTPGERALLNIPRGTPVLDLWGAIHRDDGGPPLEAGVRTNPADAVAYVADIDLRTGRTR